MKKRPCKLGGKKEKVAKKENVKYGPWVGRKGEAFLSLLPNTHPLSKNYQKRKLVLPAD
jgi:hypothetical protein